MTVMNDRSVDIGPFVPQEDDDILICRCEEISKGEIRQAVHDGIRTMEEMRRYLRNGLGIADQTQNMGVAALGIVDLQPHIFQLVAEFAYLYVGCILFEYDDHSVLSPLPFPIV